MHESTNDHMKNVVYIASDILTTENEAIADLLILTKKN